MITQNGKPIAYASRALSEAETRYAQIEKELLAIVFGMERFQQLTYGQDVTVLSDHKPLESILKKPLSSAPPRLQRMLLRLQKYTFKLQYKQGKKMVISDMLSRAYLNERQDTDRELEDRIHLYVNMITEGIAIKKYKLKQIAGETEKDQVLLALKEQIKKGFPEKKQNLKDCLQEFWNERDELSLYDGMILKGESCHT